MPIDEADCDNHLIGKHYSIGLAEFSKYSIENKVPLQEVAFLHFTVIQKCIIAEYPITSGICRDYPPRKTFYFKFHIFGLGFLSQKLQAVEFSIHSPRLRCDVVITAETR